MAASPTVTRQRPRQPRPGRPRAARRRIMASDNFTGWGFVTPGVAVILLFGAVPIVWSAVMSFQQSNLLTPSTPFVGLRNYRAMVHDPVVAAAIGHTLLYTALF